jgi:ATP-dependent DNA helicase RecG
VQETGYEVGQKRSNPGTYRVYGITALMDDPVFECGSPERYIPAEYKYNSVYTRMELLRGLLDTDGEATTSGSIGYSTTSKALADDVVWIVRSLGGKAMLQPTVKSGWYPDEKRLQDSVP